MKYYLSVLTLLMANVSLQAMIIQTNQVFDANEEQQNAARAFLVGYSDKPVVLNKDLSTLTPISKLLEKVTNEAHPQQTIASLFNIDGDHEKSREAWDITLGQEEKKATEQLKSLTQKQKQLNTTLQQGPKTYRKRISFWFSSALLSAGLGGATAYYGTSWITDLTQKIWGHQALSDDATTKLFWGATVGGTTTAAISFWRMATNWSNHREACASYAQTEVNAKRCKTDIDTETAVVNGYKIRVANLAWVESQKYLYPQNDTNDSDEQENQDTNSVASKKTTKSTVSIEDFDKLQKKFETLEQRLPSTTTTTPAEPTKKTE